MPTQEEIREAKEQLVEARRKQARVGGRSRKLERRKKKLTKRMKQAKAGSPKKKKLRKKLKETKQKSLATKGRLTKAQQATREAGTLETVTPGTPGVKTPTVEPFKTAEDIQAEADAKSQYQGTLYDLDQALRQMQIENEKTKVDIAKDRKQSKYDASNEFAGRGLFQSSIRDAELFDIDSTAELRKNRLNRALDTLTLDSQRRKNAAQHVWNIFQTNMQTKMAQNARERQEGMEPWLVEPTQEQTQVTDINLPKNWQEQEFVGGSAPSRPGGQGGGTGRGPGGSQGNQGRGGDNRPGRGGRGGRGKNTSMSNRKNPNSKTANARRREQRQQQRRQRQRRQRRQNRRQRRQNRRQRRRN